MDFVSPEGLIFGGEGYRDIRYTYIHIMGTLFVVLSLLRRMSLLGLYVLCSLVCTASMEGHHGNYLSSPVVGGDGFSLR